MEKLKIKLGRIFPLLPFSVIFRAQHPPISYKMNKMNNVVQKLRLRVLEHGDFGKLENGKTST